MLCADSRVGVCTFLPLLVGPVCVSVLAFHHLWGPVCVSVCETAIAWSGHQGGALTHTHTLVHA